MATITIDLEDIRAGLVPVAILDAMRDMSWQLSPIGEDVTEYINVKQKRLTPASRRTYEGLLAQFAADHKLNTLADFEPPDGIAMIEKFLAQWDKPPTYNRNLSVLVDFFKFSILRSKLHGDPTLAIERAKKRDVYRTTYSDSQRIAIIADQEDRRDRVALRLLLDYGIRKGALQACQFRHFDHVRKRLTIFTKGEKVRELPLPDPAFWHDLERVILDVQAEAGHYLVPSRRGSNQRGVKLYPDQPLSDHGMHDWWYRCLENAGIVAIGQRSGENMHKARHTAGQRVLNATGNLKAVQMLLGHSSIQTTGDVYADWDIDQLEATMSLVLGAGK